MALNFLLWIPARLYQKGHAPRESDQNVRLLKRSKSGKVASKATAQKSSGIYGNPFARSRHTKMLVGILNSITTDKDTYHEVIG
jgi:hypothetical protein